MTVFHHFSLQIRDRPDREEGGVCAYISTNISTKRRLDLESPDHECMWLWLRPHSSPSPSSGIICGVAYWSEAPAKVKSDR